MSKRRPRRTFRKALIISSLLVACVVTAVFLSYSEENEAGILHQNKYGGITFTSGSKKNPKGAWVYVSTSGDTIELADQVPADVYPGLYKNNICYVGDNDLVYFSSKKLSPDTILLHGKFAPTSYLFEYDTLLAVVDLDKFDIVDMRNKQLMMASDCNIGNLTISGKMVYAVVDVTDQTKESEYWIMKGSIYDGKLTRLKKFPEFPMSNPDCTTDGWNGMLLSRNVLFVKGMYHLFAFDAKTGKKLDKVAESMPLKLIKNSNSEVVLESLEDLHTFSFKTKKFE